jgi:ABC-2 type transport system ATP-binding protein
MIATKAVVIDHLTKTFDDATALADLNVEINAGELFGLLGPNGAGKTTTINILCGLQEPTSGSVRVCGFDVGNGTRKVKELIGVCPQEPALYSYLTGRENVELFGSLYSVPKDRMRKNTDAILEKIGLTEDANRRVSKYSGGMQRRINLVMALVHDPDIVFLDEPTAAMDPQSRHAVWDVIRDLNRQGKTIILTTHYMEEAEQLCDRVGIIDHGELIALDSPAQLKARYCEETLEGVFIQLTDKRIREEPK